MKQHDFLPNLILILLTGLMIAGVSNLAVRGAIPVTYTSHSEVQLAGDDLHMRDVNGFASLVSEDETVHLAVIADLDLQNAKEKTLTEKEFSDYLTVTSKPDEGVIDISVCSSDPYTSRDAANKLAATAASVYESSHEGVTVNLVGAAGSAIACDERPIFACTLIGGLIGLLAGICLTWLTLKNGRASKRVDKVDPRYMEIKEEDADEEKEYEDLFADDNEDVDPEMRELYRIARKAEAVREKPMSEEAGAAYKEAMEIEALAADDDNLPEAAGTNSSQDDGGSAKTGGDASELMDEGREKTAACAAAEETHKDIDADQAAAKNGESGDETESAEETVKGGGDEI